MSDLQSAARDAIRAFVQSEKETHTTTDVLRALRDQSALLFERQLVSDTLNADPMEQLGHVQPQVKRILDLMDVTSCSRVQTLDGFSSIHADVTWRQDEHMKNVENQIQLTFHYERRQAASEPQSSSPSESHLSYSIHFAKDYGPRERLLTIEVWAPGAGPSVEAPVPLEMDQDEEWEDISDDDDIGGRDDTEDAEMKETTQRLPTLRVNEIGNQDSGSKEKQNPDRDRYAAYLDPDVFDDFLTASQLGMDEYTVVFFLMTFPFYEHEWDLVGFVLDSCFGEAMEADDDSNSYKEDSDNDL